VRRDRVAVAAITATPAGPRCHLEIALEDGDDEFAVLLALDRRVRFELGAA
jgi:hypothetical protein